MKEGEGWVRGGVKEVERLLLGGDGERRLERGYVRGVLLRYGRK